MDITKQEQATSPPVVPEAVPAEVVPEAVPEATNNANNDVALELKEPFVENELEDGLFSTVQPVGCWAWVIGATLCVVWVVTWFVAPPFALTEPLLLAPVVALYFLWKRNEQFASLATTVSFFGMGLIPGALGIWTVESVLFFIVHGISVEAGFDPTTAKDTRVGSHLVVDFVEAFFIVSVVEEGAKYLFFRYTRQRRRLPAADTKAHFVYNTAVALGFATADNILIASALAVGHDKDFMLAVVKNVLLCVVLTFVNTTIQCATAYLTSLGVTKQFLSSAQPNTVDPSHTVVLGRAIAFHGVMFFQSNVFYDYLNFDFGMTCLFTAGTGVLILLVWFIKRKEKELPREYLLRVGYLTVADYGQIEEEDEFGSATL